MQAAVRLTAGKPVSIRVDYSSSAQLFGAQVHLAWQPPSASGIPAAVEAARHADAAIVLANSAAGEGMDRTTLALPGDQDQLIDAVAAVNRRTIVVLNTGGPVLMPWLHQRRGRACRPGTRASSSAPRSPRSCSATAIPAAGCRSPSRPSDTQGPAPTTRPERYPGINGEQRYDEGIFVGYRWYDQFRQQPLFPFGYGLSYADFRFRDLRVWADHGAVTATTRVTNTSRRAGSTVAQAYLSFPRSAGEPPRQLKGYEKVQLDPGRSAVVTFHLDRADLAYFDEGAGRQVLADGRYTLSVGSSSRDLPLSASFELGRHDHR